MIKAILFDVDGTLLDTTEYIYQAFEYGLSRNFKSLSRTEIQKIMGKPLMECYKILTGKNDVSKLIEDHQKYQHKNPNLSFPFFHTETTLILLKNKGYKIAAITTRAKISALDTLKRVGLLKYLDHFIALEDVVHPKPHPEPLEKAIKFFNISLQEAIMVGDSPVDIQAGKNAGTSTIGVTYGFHGNQILESRPDFVIHEISEIQAIL